MSKVDGKVVLELRRRAHLSLRKLAEKSNLDKRTIFEIEHGLRSANEHTAKQLALALQVERAILAGLAPLPAPDAEPECSELRVQYTNRARNALELASRKFGASTLDILELAPFLFTWAAEASLRWRKQMVEEFKRDPSKIDYVCSQLEYWGWKRPATEAVSETVESEEDSILRSEILAGSVIVGPDGRRFRQHPSWDDFNPFVLFMRKLAREIDDEAWFASWDEDMPVDYEVLHDQAKALFNNDGDAVYAVISGSAPIHLMPKEVRTGSAEARARWALAAEQEADDVKKADRP